MVRRSVREGQCQGLRRGAWTQEEDDLLRRCIDKYGAGKWRHVPKRAGLNRCRKSCRLRWINYLSPGIKKGYFDADEDDLIIRLHKLLGNRWSLIAGRIPGRTANDIKNYWNTHLSKRLHSDHKNEDANNDKIDVPLPQTISTDWSWPEIQISGEHDHQQVKVDMQILPSNQAIWDDIDLGIEDINAITDEELFLGGFGGWQDIFYDLNGFGDLGFV